MAERLAISPSYLNLIEHDRRPLTTELLLRLAQHYDLDLKAFAAGEDARLVADLAEAFGDALFEEHPLTRREIADFVATSPDVARAVVALHGAYTAARGTPRRSPSACSTRRRRSARSSGPRCAGSTGCGCRASR
jgi:transcriptional regulator with XRE-family HTH domain